MTAKLSLLATVVIGLGSGLISTLLTIFLSPRLQQRFWTQQRRFELGLANLKELQTLSGHMLFDLLEQGPKYYTKDRELGQAWLAAAIEAKNLFSKDALRRFDSLDDLMMDLRDTGSTAEPPPEMTGSEYSELVDSFWDAREVAVRALYRDLGIASRELSVFIRMRWLLLETMSRLRRKITGRPLDLEEVEKIYVPREIMRSRRRRVRNRLPN